MLDDCLRVFEHQMELTQGRILYDNYRPKPGSHFLVEIGEDGLFSLAEPIEIRYDKKNQTDIGIEHEEYNFICKLDYYSQLISMNKPIDSKKQIHSCHYFSFFVKKNTLKEGKLTENIIRNYYENLKDPLLKYKDKATREMYLSISDESKLGLPDVPRIVEIESWIIENLHNLPINLDQKDYLKIFFVMPDQITTLRKYKQEYERYLLPNIYNSNDYNVRVHGQIVGLPNDNMSMNSKKPYLANRSRKKTSSPQLVTQDYAIKQKEMFDFLLANAAENKMLLYFNLDDRTIQAVDRTTLPGKLNNSIYLRISKGTEAEILDVDQISQYKRYLKKTFYNQAMIHLPYELNIDIPIVFGAISKKSDFLLLLDQILFSRQLANNFFTEASDLRKSNSRNLKGNSVLQWAILTSRDALFDYFYKSDTFQLASLLELIASRMVRDSIKKGRYLWAVYQFNLQLSLRDYFSGTEKEATRMQDVRTQAKIHMDYQDDWNFSSDAEFFFVSGQVIHFLLSRSKAEKTTDAVIIPFLNIKNSRILKDRMKMLFRKYAYSIDSNNFRFHNLYGHVCSYQTDADVDSDMLLAGYLQSNLIFSVKENKS